jgi:uncharacterized SAM-binding protein YcdF (DUF218 family)
VRTAHERRPRRGVRRVLLVLRWTVALILLFALALVVVALPLTVFPDAVALPRDADVVVVLAGGSGERLDRAVGLMNRPAGAPASLLLLSDAEDPSDPDIAALCGTAGPDYAVACFSPDPVTTAGEAQAIGRLAQGQDWDRIALVTSTYHATRARRRFERCVDAEVQVVTAAPPGGMGERALKSLRELAALARDAVDDGSC